MLTHAALAWSFVLIGMLVLPCGCAGGHSPRTDHAPAARAPQEPTHATGLLFREVAIGSVSHRYMIFVPREYDAKKTWPCVVFLNGSGECGTDGARQTLAGLGPVLLADQDRWPCVAVFPQKPTSKKQWSEHDDLVMATLDATRSECNIDESRIYLTGLSQGGAGTWSLGAKHPALWAALMPVCGYGDPQELAGPLVNIPIWAFHGGKDDVVPPAKTTAIIDEIKLERMRRNVAGDPGPDPKLTIFPDANHNSWDPTYRDPKTAAWLFAQCKRSNK